MSFYKSSTAQHVSMLANLKNILQKGEDFGNQLKINADVLLNARLFPNMFTLTRQVQIATDMVRHAGGRIAGIELLKCSDTESSFAELYGRIDLTKNYLNKISPSAIDGQESKHIIVEMRDQKLEFNALDYINKWVNPNFYFHVTTAYAILRHHGVALGKGDFLGS